MLQFSSPSVLAADHMCPRSSVSPSNCNSLQHSEQASDHTTESNVLSFLMSNWKSQVTLHSPGGDSVIHSVNAQASLGLIMDLPLSIIRLLAAPCCYECLILSVNQLRRAGNETHNTDSAGNSHLSGHTQAQLWLWQCKNRTHGAAEEHVAKLNNW